MRVETGVYVTNVYLRDVVGNDDLGFGRLGSPTCHTGSSVRASTERFSCSQQAPSASEGEEKCKQLQGMGSGYGRLCGDGPGHVAGAHLGAQGRKERGFAKA